MVSHKHRERERERDKERERERKRERERERERFLLEDKQCYADSVHDSSHKQIRHGQVIVADTGIAIATIKQNRLVESALTENEIDDVLVPRYERCYPTRADSNLLNRDIFILQGTIRKIWHRIANCYRGRSLSVRDILLSTVDETFTSSTGPEAERRRVGESGAGIRGAGGQEIEYVIAVGRGGVVGTRREGVVGERVGAREERGGTQRIFHGDVDGVWDDDEAEPEGEDDKVHDEQPAEVDEVRDDCRAKVTFDLLHVAIPEPVAQSNSQARLDLRPFLQCKVEKCSTCIHNVKKGNNIHYNIITFTKK